MNHHREEEVLSVLRSCAAEVVVIHPRGTGYSTGLRGDADVDGLILDHLELIRFLTDEEPERRWIFYGYSMSTALALEIGVRIPEAAGFILVNPPYLRKEAEGMTPSCGDYLRYVGYTLFASRTPIVNMGGNPESIENPEERREAEERFGDPLLISYFSMRTMIGSQKMISRMEDHAEKVFFPLLLVYGTADSIVERRGCELIFEAWGASDKTFLEIPGGPHGKETVLQGAEEIGLWINRITSPE